MINGKRLAALWMAIIFMVLLPSGVMAEGKNAVSSAKINAETTKDNGPDFDFKSTSSLLMNLDTGEIYHARNIDAKVYPASTTKIITAILALEHGKLTDTMTVSRDAVKLQPGASGIGLLPGEKVTLSDMMYALLVKSANDSANVIAEYVSGSIPKFVEKMNAKAKELGCKHTHFDNTNGLPDENHYTTARDMALIAKYCMKNKEFRKFVKTAKYTMQPTNKYDKTRPMITTNKLLQNSRYAYSKAIGIKTGFTTPAGHCLIAAATDGNLSLLSVVMGAPIVDGKEYCYDETISLFKWGFSYFRTQVIASGNQTVSEVPVAMAKRKDAVALATKNEVKVLLPKDANKNDIKVKYKLYQNVRAPIKKGQVLGSADYYYQSKKVGSVSLIATQDLEQDKLLSGVDAVYRFLLSPFFLIPLIVILLIIFAIVVIRKIHTSRKRKGYFMTSKKRNYRR